MLFIRKADETDGSIVQVARCSLVWEICAFGNSAETQLNMKRQTKTWAIKRSLCSPRKPSLTQSSLAVPTLASNNRASVPPPLAFCSSFHVACRHMVAEYIFSLSSSRCPFLPGFCLASDTSTWLGIKGLSLSTVRRAIFYSFDVAHSLDMLHRKTYHVKV